MTDRRHNAIREPHDAAELEGLCQSDKRSDRCRLRRALTEDELGLACDPDGLTARIVAEMDPQT